MTQATEHKRGGDASILGRVLVVDDHEDSATSLSLLLGSLGYQVEMAHDGLEGVATAERFRPHIVFMDIGMPRLDGYEAARRVRQAPWGADMVLVALTGWGQEEDRRQAEEAGFNFHLVKPLDFAHVKTLIEELRHAAPATRKSRRTVARASRRPDR